MTFLETKLSFREDYDGHKPFNNEYLVNVLEEIPNFEENAYKEILSKATKIKRRMEIRITVHKLIMRHNN